MISGLAFIALMATAPAAVRPEWGDAPRTDRITSQVQLTQFLSGLRRTPTFARQMKLSCNACHLGGFPQLTRFGRLFKLNGYTLSGLPQIVEQLDTLSQRSLSLSPIPGLSMAAVIGATRIGRPLKGAERTTANYPLELSLFFGGEIAPRLGALAELSYSDASGQIGIGNTDVRFASHTTLDERDLLYGVTLHNNPTVQDVWNTARAWSYPFVSPEVGPEALATPLLDGGLAQTALGLGAYSLFNNMLYTEISAYLSAPQRRARRDSAAIGTIRNIAPYWRVALQNRHGSTYLMVGTFGLAANLHPVGSVGMTNTYQDIGVDAQAERDVGNGTVVVRASWIHEQQRLAASFASSPPQAAQRANALESVRASIAYAPNRVCQLTLGVFGVSGSRDTLLYAPAIATGSRVGTPNSKGATGELTLSPWLNARVSLQYVAYQKFNGARRFYDVPSTGRDAKDNNTLMLYTWFAF